MIAERSRYGAIVHDLKQKILAGEYQPGQALPSHKELTERHRVALGTVRQAVSILAKEGWVRAEQGRGVFVQPRALRRDALDGIDGHNGTIGFIVIGDLRRYSLVSQLMLHGAMTALQGTGRSIQYANFCPGQPLEPFLSDTLDKVSGVLVAHCGVEDGWQSDTNLDQIVEELKSLAKELFDTLNERNLPTVLIGEPLEEGLCPPQVSNVLCDAGLAAGLAVQALVVHGHKRLGFAYSLESQYFQKCREGFERACHEYGLGPYELFHTPTRADELEMVQSLAGMPDLTGLVVVDDQSACRLIHGLKLHAEVEVPSERSVISVGGVPRHLLSEPDLARVNTNYEAMGAEAVQLLLASHARSVQKWIQIRFEPGSTVAAPSVAQQ